MPARNSGVNLLPKSEFELSLAGKFLSWAITTGRYIIIATELVVILAFLSRFKLDQDLSDVNTTISGQKMVLTRQMSLENEFRLTQARVNSAGTMMKTQVGTKNKFEKLLGSLPAPIKLLAVTMKLSETSITAATLSEDAIGELLARLKQDSYWRELEMTDFQTVDGSEIKFTLVMRN